MQKKDLEMYAKDSSVSKKDVDAIIQKHLQLSKTEVFLLEIIENQYFEMIKLDIQKRKQGVPLEYILEKANFFSLDFFVDNRVLIPRNDTEVLVEEVLKIENLEQYFLIDIGTGSGAIPISIVKNTKLQHALAIDISSEALEVAEKNIKNHNLEEKIKTLQSDLLSEIVQKKESERYFYDSGFSSEGQNKKNLIITANLPYIKNGDFENMSSETLQFEPNLALFGGENTGFELYEKLIEQIFELQCKLCGNPEVCLEGQSIPEIFLFIEIGFDQKKIAERFLRSKNLHFEIFSDASGISRCIKIFFDF